MGSINQINDLGAFPPEIREKLLAMIQESAGNELRLNEIKQLISAMKRMTVEEMRNMLNYRITEDRGSHKPEAIYPDIDMRTGKQILNG
jgi:hypothetical protein